VTAIVADVVDETPVASVGTVLGAAVDPDNLVDPTAVRALRSA
jgi:hypothetical protein